MCVLAIWIGYDSTWEEGREGEKARRNGKRKTFFKAHTRVNISTKGAHLEPIIPHKTRERQKYEKEEEKERKITTG